MKYSIGLLIFASLIASNSIDASLKMKAMGFWNRNHNTPKPWDGDSRSRTHYDDYQLPVMPQEEGSPTEQVAGDAPCVGMCYYKKIMGLEEKESKEEKAHNEVIENEPAEAKERKPCVGLCHYYRSMGMENPYEKRPFKRFPVMN